MNTLSLLAYIGPGSGLSALGALAALLLAGILAIFGFVWYPIKRMLRGGNPEEQVAQPSEAAQEAPKPDSQ